MFSKNLDEQELLKELEAQKKYTPREKTDQYMKLIDLPVNIAKLFITDINCLNDVFREHEILYSHKNAIKGIRECLRFMYSFPSLKYNTQEMRFSYPSEIIDIGVILKILDIYLPLFKQMDEKHFPPHKWTVLHFEKKAITLGIKLNSKFDESVLLELIKKIADNLHHKFWEAKIILIKCKQIRTY